MKQNLRFYDGSFILTHSPLKELPLLVLLAPLQALPRTLQRVEVLLLSIGCFPCTSIAGLSCMKPVNIKNSWDLGWFMDVHPLKSLTFDSSPYPLLSRDKAVQSSDGLAAWWRLGSLLGECQPSNTGSCHDELEYIGKLTNVRKKTYSTESGGHKTNMDVYSCNLTTV
jgi:hypothetical protein